LTRLKIYRKIDIMLDFSNEKVEAFGKVIFASKNHNIPALPDMNLILFKKESGYQAICINVEIDAVDNDAVKCCNNLRRTLLAYIKQMVDNYNGNVKEAVEDIINVSYSESELKSQLFARYLQAKRQYLLNRVAKEHKAKSRKDELVNAVNRVFQFEPIRFNLAKVAAFA